MNISAIHDHVPSVKTLGKKTVAVAFIVTIITFVCGAAQRNRALISTEPTAGDVLHERIDRGIRGLEDSNTVAPDFIDMVGDWTEAPTPRLARSID